MAAYALSRLPDEDAIDENPEHNYFDILVATVDKDICCSKAQAVNRERQGEENL